MRWIVHDSYIFGWKLVATGLALAGIIPGLFWGLFAAVGLPAKVFGIFDTALYWIGLVLVIVGIIRIRSKPPMSA